MLFDLFFNNHGSYEVLAKVRKHYFEKKEKEIILLIDADGKYDAEKIAKRQLKDSGYSNIDIMSVRLKKYK